MQLSTLTYASFDDILNRYTGDTKMKMEDACSARAAAMFNVLRTLSPTKLSSLKGGSSATSTLYAALLDTPHGRYFEQTVGDEDVIKQFAFLAATETIDAEGLVNPLYDSENSGGASGASDTTPGQPGIPALGTGLDCLPTGVNGTNLSLRNQVVVLNRLVFSTPHSFWVDHADDLRNSSRFNTWLGYGPDWSCTSWVDVSDAVCRKHDVGYASLQGFAGATSTAEESNEMDEAWNPRNKHLADAVALADIVQHDCQTPSVFAQLIACPPTAGVTAGILHWGVNKINTKTWPYTEHDIAHSSSFPRYVIPFLCDVTAFSLGSLMDSRFHGSDGGGDATACDLRRSHSDLV